MELSPEMFNIMVSANPTQREVTDHGSLLSVSLPNSEYQSQVVVAAGPPERWVITYGGEEWIILDEVGTLDEEDALPVEKGATL